MQSCWQVRYIIAPDVSRASFVSRGNRETHISVHQVSHIFIYATISKYFYMLQFFFKDIELLNEKRLFYIIFARFNFVRK